MHILLIADGRSTITRGWLRMLEGLSHRVSLVSTFPCTPPEGAELAGVLPVGFSALAGGQVRLSGGIFNENFGERNWKRRLLSAFRPAFLGARAWLGPLTIGKFQTELLKIIGEIKPDLVHALRVPFEGMLAEVTPEKIPLLVSIWGNDLTLHASSSPLMSARTRRVLARADGLLADAGRDVRLASAWGLNTNAPAVVVPGNGGLDLGKIREVIRKKELPIALPINRPLVVNPRGFRPGSVHQDTFFKSIPLVLERIPDVFFICTAMLGQPAAEAWVKKLGIPDHVLLLPYLPQEQLWQLYAHSQIYVSLSSHDGTPNTFLEALACGCFPVVGDIESLREWLKDGENGLLVNPRDPVEAAAAITRALSDDGLRKPALVSNKKLVRERADLLKIRKQIAAYLDSFAIKLATLEIFRENTGIQ